MEYQGVLAARFNAKEIHGCGISSWEVPGAQLLEALAFLKREAVPLFEMLFDLSAVDHSEQAQSDFKGYSVFYHLISLSANCDIRVFVRLQDDSVATPSITSLWPSADWYEREVYDMFGLRFSEHPNLKRLLMPEYWQGYPLRKTYPFRATDMPSPFDLDSEDYARIMQSYAIPDERAPGEDDVMYLNIGPNHPGTHGIIRLMVKLRGERLLEITPEIGFHHRGAEKLAERHTYHNYIPYTDRIDYLGGVAGELPYLLALEALAKVTVPERATVIRVMLTELFRLSSHLVWLGSFGHDVGAMGPAFYCFQVREKIFDAVEMITGARMHPAFFRIGGVALDLPEGWEAAVRDACLEVEKVLPDLESLTIGSKLFQKRSRDVAVVSQAQALDWGFSGPNLRATGVDWDLRKVRPYCGYEHYDFDVPVADYGDCFNRVRLRILEMYESIKIVRQTLNKMPGGPILSSDCSHFAFPDKNQTLQNIETLIHHFVDMGRGFRMPVGESFFATETSKGMTGYYVLSDGGSCPYRLRIRTPSVPHFQSVKAVCEGDQIGNMIPYISSIDYVLADLDR